MRSLQPMPLDWVLHQRHQLPSEEVRWCQSRGRVEGDCWGKRVSGQQSVWLQWSRRRLLACLQGKQRQHGIRESVVKWLLSPPA